MVLENIRFVGSYRFYISLSLSIYIIVQKEKVFKFLGGTVGSRAGLSVNLDVGLDVGLAY